MPSSIRLDDGHRLWFGTLAEVGHGQVFRSFKVCAACQAGATVCRGCNQINLEKDTPPPGRFADSLFSFISAYELMIYYLAWLLHKVDKIIQEEFGQFVEPKLHYNLGVPVAHLNASRDLVNRFKWILHTSLALRGKIQQGISATQARSHLIEVLPQAFRPLHNDRYHCAVLPETAAAAMWLQKTANGIDNTNYMLIDIGAGTTDITIYRYNRVNPDAMPIYGTKSIYVAGDNIDFSTIQWFVKVAREYGVPIGNPSQIPSSLLQVIRWVKEFLPKPGKPMEAIFGEKRIVLNEQTYVNDIVASHAKSIFKTACETFSDAYKLAPHERHFSEIKIVLLGGGSRIVGMHQYFKNNRLRNFMEQRVLEPHISNNEEDRSCVNDPQLLAVAYGLAFPPAEFPRIRMPSQISPLIPPESNPPPEYDDNPLLSN